MIEIIFKREPSGDICSVSVDGHAEFSDSEHGGDIVCSAVSALVGYLGLYFSEVSPGLGEVSASDGRFDLSLLPANRSRPEVRSLLQAWRRAVGQLEENYSGWVKIAEQTNTTQEQM